MRKITHLYKLILFLDIDGVLNSDSFQRTSNTWPTAEEMRQARANRPYQIPFLMRLLSGENVTNLKNLMDQFPDLLIVVSSSWVCMMDIELIRELFSYLFIKPERIIGITPRKMTANREGEIIRWVEEYDQSLSNHYLILDDLDLSFISNDKGKRSQITKHLSKYFLKTDSELGFTEENLVLAKTILENQKAG
ncbi:MAG: hypothetical protein EOO20_20960 [Chryseobacterium sp.]|nr:MAG: hypothetical protein EOO20_20960 [Chryseobacterium sp.]